MFYLSYLLCLGDIVTRLFSILLTLDRHHFDRVEQNSSLDTLYTKIFGGHDTKESKVCLALLLLSDHLAQFLLCRQT